MGWVEPVEKHPSYVIFQEGTTIHAKAGFTGGYNYKGKNASTVINWAIERTNALGGGIVHLRQGTYDISAAIIMRADITLEGEGYGTNLFLTTGHIHNVIQNVNNGIGVDDNLGIKNMRLTGRYSEYLANGRLIDINFNALPPNKGLDLENLWLMESNKISMFLRNVRGTYRNLYLYNFDDYGIQADSCTDMEWDTVYINGPAPHFFFDGMNESNLVNFYLAGVSNGGPACKMVNSNKNQLANWVYDSMNRVGLEMDNCDKNQFVNQRFTRCGKQTDNTYDAITLNDSFWNDFVNVFVGRKELADANWVRDAIRETGTSDYNTYTNINAPHIRGNALTLLGVNDKYGGIVGAISIPAYVRLFVVGHPVSDVPSFLSAAAGVPRSHAVHRLANSASSDWGSETVVPDDFESLNSIKLVCVPAAAGNAYCQWGTCYAALGENYEIHDNAVAWQTITFGAGDVDDICEVDLGALWANLAIGDYVGVHFKRDANDEEDTLEDVLDVLGMAIYYIAREKNW